MKVFTEHLFYAQWSYKALLYRVVLGPRDSEFNVVFLHLCS